MIVKKTSVNPYIVNWETNPPIQSISSLKHVSEIIDSGIYSKISSGLPGTLSGSYKNILTTTHKEADQGFTQITPANLYLQKFVYSTESTAIKEFHHIVVKGPQRLFTSVKGDDISDKKLSFDFFQDYTFVTNLKRYALKQYCSSLPNDVGNKIKRGVGDTNEGKIKKSILENTSLTDFSISTGKESAGSLVYFQFIVAIPLGTSQLIKSMKVDSAAPKILTSNTFKVKSFNLYDHVGSAKFPKLENGNDYLDHFKCAIRLLKIVSQKNKKLESKQKYVVDLDSHIGEIETYYNHLIKDKLSIKSQNEFICRNGYINYSFTTFNPNTGKNTNVYYLHNQGTCVKKYKDTNTTSKLETKKSVPSTISKTPEEKAKLNPDTSFEPPSADYINNFSNNFRSILYNIDFITKDYKKFGEKISVDAFVKSYLVDYLKESQLKNTPQRSTSKKVYNNGEIKYKKTEDIENERALPKDLKQQIFSLVEGSFVQTTDAAFLNIIKNSDQIKSIEDVYNSVLNVVPLDEIVSVAMSCAKKYLDDPLDKVRDTILKNIRKEEIAKIMSYINTSGTIESKALQKAIAKEIKASGANFVEEEITKNLNILKDILISLFAKNDINKDLISIAIFSSLPAAAQMAAQIYGAAESLFDGSEDRSISESSVEQFADKNSTIIEKYTSKYKSNITQLINNNLKDLQGTDFSSIGVLNVSDLGLENIDLEGLGLDVFDLGSLSSLGDLNFGSIGDLRNLDLSSFAKLSNINLTDLANIDGFGLDLNNLNLADFLNSEEISNFVNGFLGNDIEEVIEDALRQAQDILNDVTKQVNKVFDQAEKTLDEISSQATSYLDQVSAKANEYQKQAEEIIDKTEEILKGAGNLNNPFESVGKAIEDALEKYNSVSLISDWSEKLKNSLLEFVQEYITNLVSAILKEISKLCEGTSKSDFSNLGSKAPNINFPQGVTPVFPFTPNFLDEIITDDNVANDIGDYIDRPPEEINEFIADLPEVLTISECCSLFSEDSSRLTNDLIMDKVWSGALSLPKYNELKNAIGSKGNLITVFSILAPFIDKEKCVATIKGLEDTKKILSEFCEPISNEAIIGDLLQKATSEVVGEIIKKEDKALEDLLSNLKDVSDLANNFPPVFCGPEAELKEQKPIFGSSMHSSTKYLQDKQLNNAFKTITDVFETDILNFKVILSNNIKRASDLLNKGEKLQSVFNAGSEVAGAISSIYKMGENVDDLPDQVDKKYLEKKARQTRLIARDVKYQLEKINSTEEGGTAFNIQVPEGGEEGKLISLSTDYISNDKISLDFNFSEQLYQNPNSQQTDIIPPRTARLRVGNDNNNVEYFTPFTSDQDYNKLTENLFLDTRSSDSEYDFALQSFFSNNSHSLSFFTEIVSQIIKEHAEYISSQDLFKRSTFNKLRLNRKNACAASLLYTKDIFDEVEITSDNIQCLFGIEIVPTPPEIAKISAFIKLYIRTIVINEILKGIFVFGAYGFNALLAKSDAQSFDSFYLKYLKSQIKKQLYPATLGSTKSTNLKQGFPEDVDFIKYLKIDYAANNNIKKVDSVTENQVFNFLIDQTIVVVKDRMDKILFEADVFTFDKQKDFLNASFESYILNDEFEGGKEEAFFDKAEEDGQAAADSLEKEFELENYSKYLINSEFTKTAILKNLLETNFPDTSEASPNVKDKGTTILPPPDVINIDAENNYFIVPDGYYTQKNNGRLKNGGFFLEQGYEVSHVFKDTEVFGNNKFDARINFPFSDYNLIRTALSEADTIGTPGVYNGFEVKAVENEYSRSKFVEMFSGINSIISIPGDDPAKQTAKFLIGGYSQKSLGELDSTELFFLSQFGEGRMGFDKFEENYGDKTLGYAEILSGFIEAAILNAPNENTKVRLQKLKNKNLYFKKYNGYTTLNLLLPVTEDTPTELIYKRLSLAASAHELDPSSDESVSYKTGFARAVLDKKYFLREGSDGQIFFKLPLVYLAHKSKTDYSGVLQGSTGTVEVTKNMNQVASDYYKTIGKNLIDIINSISDPGSVEFGGADTPVPIPASKSGPPNEGDDNLFPVDVYQLISDSVSFQRLTDNLQYESILSFVSVLITETVQQKYPALDSTFDRTLTLIKTALAPIINVSKRQEDPNFYQKGNPIDSLGLEIPDVNIDLLMLILESLLKSLATMCDPTWKTPWFLPGPLTPFGIVAKLLDDSDSVDNIDKLKDKENELKTKINDSLECGSPIES